MYVHFNGLKIRGVLKEFSISLRLLVQKCKKQLFEENKCFQRSFYQIKVQMITNLSSRLEKHQTLDILLMTEFS